VNASYSVSEVSDQTGLSAHTLRWYEQVGLLDPVDRDTAGRRRYVTTDMDRLRFLIKLRSTGMPVREMVRYIELARRGEATVAERLEILVEHRQRVLAQIEALTDDLKIIEYKIDLYSEAEVEAEAVT
jgi:DNA-binding transcriptional MerR regulator